MPRLFNSSIHSIANLASDSCEKKRLIGAGWLRIIFGAITTIMFALHFHQRHVLWGPLGVLNRKTTLCFALRLFTSITKFLFFVSTRSLYQRDYYANRALDPAV